VSLPPTDEELARLRWDYSKAGEDPSIVPLLDAFDALRGQVRRMREMFREAGIPDEHVEAALNARPADEVLAPYYFPKGGTE
jgi:hypothetical protein